MESCSLAGEGEPETIYAAVASSRMEHGPYSRSKVNFVDCCHVIFEKHHGVESYSLGLAHRVVTGYLLVQVLEMKILNMVPHVRNAFERASPLVVCIPLVPDAEDALGLTQNEGKLIELREGIRRGGGCVRLCLNRIHEGRRRLRLAGLRLLSRSERGLSVDGKYLPRYRLRTYK